MKNNKLFAALVTLAPMMPTVAEAQTCGPKTYCFVSSGELSVFNYEVEVILQEFDSGHRRSFLYTTVSRNSPMLFEAKKRDALAVVTQLAADGQCTFLNGADL